MNTTAYTYFFTNYAPLIKYAEEHSGLKLATLTDITNLYDTLFIERLKGKWLVSQKVNYLQILNTLKFN